MKTLATQNLVNRFADYSWQLLADFFQPKKLQKRPPVYLFLSPESKGTLADRSAEEKELVHSQQFLGQGITLIEPPLAYVSNLSQVPEETAHLFAICHQKTSWTRLEKMSEKNQILAEYKWMTQHECFGRFANIMIAGLSENVVTRPKTKKILREEDIWVNAHREGYFLGQEMAKKYFDGRLTIQKIRKWFASDWMGL